MTVYAVVYYGLTDEDYTVEKVFACIIAAHNYAYKRKAALLKDKYLYRQADNIAVISLEVEL